VTSAGNQRDLLLVFGTVQRVLRGEKAARGKDLDVDVIPAPRTISSECGVVLECRNGEAAALSEVLEEISLSPQSAYRLRGGGWVLTSLESADTPEGNLTRNTAYGGCGAKLSKGMLHSILCGLPTLESEDLIVGIENADDAGVLRINAEQAIIHTADFFPPMVDDPFSFGRIAAVNALSDVYAMGGKPLAGINLVSFPLAQHDRDVLKEILRGGISALEDAGAVLAGGHTVEGAELLYGMAITGMVHPDRVWRNAGAMPGDELVLTKPLGTGLITTAAKAQLADPKNLTGAIRWMATLNRDAAEAARKAEPSAVTDVTGFGLAGHAAEMAEASGVEIVLELNALPLLPGAYDAAGTGMVPAGAGKNRQSLENVLEVEEGIDPLLSDLTMDPQTSGGLLVACSAERARELSLALSGAEVVGRCVEGVPGRVRLVQEGKPRG